MVLISYQPSVKLSKEMHRYSYIQDLYQCSQPYFMKYDTILFKYIHTHSHTRKYTHMRMHTHTDEYFKVIKQRKGLSVFRLLKVMKS